jgi:hypothetical protein
MQSLDVRTGYYCTALGYPTTDIYIVTILNYITLHRCLTREWKSFFGDSKRDLDKTIWSN